MTTPHSKEAEAGARNFSDDDHHYHSSRPYDPLENNEQPFLPVFHRRRADPAPLGFLALGSGLWAISIVAMGTDNLTSLEASTAISLCYCAVAFLIAGIWEFPTGNSWGAAFFTSLSGLFLSTAYTLSPWSEVSTSYTDANEFSHAVFIVLVVLTIAAHRSSGGLLCALFFVDMFLMMISIYYYTENAKCLTAAGAFGIIAAFVSWYAALSTLLNEHNSMFRLPVLLDLSPKTAKA
ncbi:hypothetical protein RQP46_005475 [Phenoliferia psychrophenolica]